MGDERTWHIWKNYKVHEIAGPDTDTVRVVPASVLEERDRELEVERRRSNGVASHAGHWAKCARESALQAERLRSQLTEARAAKEALEKLRAYAESPCLTAVDPHELWLQLSEAVHEAIRKGLGLVPAPQGREPA